MSSWREGQRKREKERESLRRLYAQLRAAHRADTSKSKTAYISGAPTRGNHRYRKDRREEINFLILEESGDYD